MKRAINAVINVELVLLGLILAVTVLPLAFGFKTYIVQSGSMEPEIPTGSLVYVDTNVDTASLAVGDVIAFDHGKIDITHRIAEIDPGTGEFITKGDANGSNDPDSVAPSQVIGKTVLAIPSLGYAEAFFLEHRVLLVIALALVNAALFIAAHLASKKSNTAPKQDREPRAPGKDSE